MANTSSPYDPNIVASSTSTSTSTPTPPQVPTGVKDSQPLRLGLMSFKTLSIMEAEDREKGNIESTLDEKEGVSIPLSSLSAYIQSHWIAARDNKNKITNRLLECLRRRNGEYDPEMEAEIAATGGSSIFMMLTDEKCAAAEAWLHDILMPPGEKPYSIEPTPIPDINPSELEEIKTKIAAEAYLAIATGNPVSTDDVKSRIEEMREELLKRAQSMAEEKASAMSDVIEDRLVEGNFYQALDDVISDIVTYPSGILKGPIYRTRMKNTWKRNNDGSYSPHPTKVIVEEYERKSPFDIFPSPSSKGVDDGALIDINWLTFEDLHAVKGIDGFSAKAIDSVMENPPSVIDNYMYPFFQEMSSLHDRPQEWRDPDGKIPAIQFWGKVPGNELLEYGFSTSQVPDPEALYECEVWQVGPWTIKCEFNNDPLLRRPYSKSSFRKKVGSFWGRSVPEIIKDSQDVCNASARALVNNLSIASGPQVYVDVSQLPAGETITNMFPWKIWQINGEKAPNGRAPIAFFQPNSNTQELLLVYRHFSEEADNKSGIPKYVYGSGGSSGALSTATGMTVMMNNAAKGLKKVIFNIDRDIIEPTVSREYDSIMMYGEDDFIKGDIKIRARGSSSLIIKEQRQIRLNEALKTTSNPVDMGLMGPKARLFLLRSIFKDLLGSSIDEVFPDPENIAETPPAPVNPNDPNNQALNGRGSGMTSIPGSVPQPGGPAYGGAMGAMGENNGMSVNTNPGGAQ